MLMLSIDIPLLGNHKLLGVALHKVTNLFRRTRLLRSKLIAREEKYSEALIVVLGLELGELLIV